MYGYVGGNPVKYFDPDGLEPYPGLSRDIRLAIESARESSSNSSIQTTSCDGNCPTIEDVFNINNETVWYSYWGGVGSTAEELRMAAKINATILSSVFGGPTVQSCKTIVKKNVNKKNLRRAACAAGFAAACTQGKLGQMDSIADHVQTVRGVTQSSRLPQQTTHLPK